MIALGGSWYAWKTYWRVEAPILVGILHSQTGPLAISEQSMIDAELMAIDEINQQGGLLGRKVKAVIADGRSDPKVFAQEARRLIETEKVSVIFGCWTSLCRRSVKSVVEPSNHLLFFPSNYEGMDIPSCIVCTGPIPNQQVIPAVNWCFETLKARKFFLAGSQDIQSYSSNALIKDQLKAMGAQTVGEKYVALDGTGMPDMIAAIKAAGPDVVLSTVAGDGNKPFYQQLAQAGLTSARLPVLSFTIAEDELRELPVKEMIGDYAAWSYFQSIDSPVNRAFVQRFKNRYGAERTTSDSIVAAYNSCQALGTSRRGVGYGIDVRRPQARSANESLDAPEGVVSIDAETLHTWRPFYLGKIRGDGQFEIVWSLEKPVRPVPYPVLRSRADWNAFVERLYTTWGTNEFNPQTLTDSPEPAPALTRRPVPSARQSGCFQRPTNRDPISDRLTFHGLELAIAGSPQHHDPADALVPGDLADPVQRVDARQQLSLGALAGAVCPESSGSRSPRRRPPSSTNSSASGAETSRLSARRPEPSRRPRSCSQGLARSRLTEAARLQKEKEFHAYRPQFPGGLRIREPLSLCRRRLGCCFASSPTSTWERTC